MRIEISEGYDIVLEPENDRDRARLRKLYDKYLESGGLEADLFGVPDFWAKLVVRPKRQPHELTETRASSPSNPLQKPRGKLMLFKDVIERTMVDPPVRSTRLSRSYHPSAASIAFRCPVTNRIEKVGTCLRREYFRVTGEPTTEQADGPGTRKMQAGNYLQPVLEEALKMAGLWRGSEVAFYNRTMNVSGRIDCWLVDPTRSFDGKEVLMPCEIKTCGKWKEDGTCRPDRFNQFRPSTDNLLQCIPYLDYYGQFILTSRA